MGSRAALHTKRYRAFVAGFIGRARRAELSQQQVADALDREHTGVSKCEIGERRVDFVELEGLAAIYGKPLEWFATRRSQA